MIRAATLALALAACGAPSSTAPLVLHCDDPTCPPITIDGDPPAPAAQHPFRGYGDPSLERDPSTGTLWLAYSFLATIATGPQPLVDFGVSLRLARSDDGGRTFRFVRAVRDVAPATHWDDPSRAGLLEQEVSTLVRQPDGAWQLLWLAYFDPLGDGPRNRTDLFLARTRAADPAALGDTVEPWLRAAPTSAAAAPTRITDVPGLADCAVPTEPALFSDGNATWLAVTCLGASERVALLRLDDSAPAGLTHAGTLLAAADARAAGVDHLQQLDLAIARDGRVLAIVTPITDGADPQHGGCLIYEVEDLPTARLRRDASGRPLLRARVTSVGNGLGPGLCTYDAASDTGLLIVSTDFALDINPPRLAFTLRRTGLHP